MLKTEKFTRKPFVVEAVRVTEENLEQVAEWCGGEVRTAATGIVGTTPTERPYVHVRVVRPLNVKQSQAFVGDWVLYAGTGYKVYTAKAFERSFEPVFVQQETLI